MFVVVAGGGGEFVCVLLLLFFGVVLEVPDLYFFVVFLPVLDLEIKQRIVLFICTYALMQY